MRVVPLKNSASIRTCLNAALAQNGEYNEQNDEDIKVLSDILFDHRELLFEYFSIEINNNREIVGIPELLSDYLPLPEQLPMFLLRLVTEVNWSEEAACFSDIANEISLFYSKLATQPLLSSISGDRQQILTSDSQKKVETLIIPALKCRFFPPKNLFNEKNLIEVSSLANLYKIFERC